MVLKLTILNFVHFFMTISELNKPPDKKQYFLDFLCNLYAILELLVICQSFIRTLEKDGINH